MAELKRLKGQTLATFYRPKNWDSVSGQDSVKAILQEQIRTGTFKNAYAFCGSSGCGKTTLCRLFASEINQGQGNPIEIDAATSGTVDRIREITDSAKKKSLDSEYKIFIIDEAHGISSSGWQAMLKTLEDCPKTTIFMLATTEFDKIPDTIKNRVQVFTISKISTEDIFNRLKYICEQENIEATEEALVQLSKLSNGGMRDAISMLDKVSSLGDSIDIDSVVRILGIESYITHFDLIRAISMRKTATALEILEQVYTSGKDLKAFLKAFMTFCVDVCKFRLFKNTQYIQIPPTKEYLELLSEVNDDCFDILDFIVEMNNTIKWESNPLHIAQALLICHTKEGELK